MEFEFTKHALKRACDRGISLGEIENAILSVSWDDAKYNRFSVIKMFGYNQIWESVFYKEKEVKVIFIKENDKITVITVIVRYFKG